MKWLRPDFVVGRVLERAPAVSEVPARVIDRGKEGNRSSDHRRHHDGKDEHAGGAPHPGRKLEPPVEQRVHRAGDRGGRGQPQQREARVMARVGESGLRVEGRGQRLELGGDQRGHDHGRHQQSEAVRHHREHDHRGDRERDSAALALGHQPGREDRGRSSEREPADDDGQPPLGCQHQGGPEADQEHRRRGVRVRDRPGQAAVTDEVRGRRSEPSREGGRDRQRPGAERDGAGDDEPLDARTDGEQRGRGGGDVEEREERVVAGERRQRRPGGRDRLPRCEGDERSEGDNRKTTRRYRRAREEDEPEQEGRENRIEQPVARVDAACFQPGEDARGGNERDRRKRTGGCSVLHLDGRGCHSRSRWALVVCVGPTTWGGLRLLPPRRKALAHGRKRIYVVIVHVGKTVNRA